MKRAFSLLLAALFVLLIGCGSEYRPVKPVGTVPEEFVPIVENNLFCSYSLASPNGILRSVQTDADGEGHTDTIDFFKYDKYGTELAHLRYPDADSHHLTMKMHTSDGGFLFVDGFYAYARKEGGWSDEAGYSSDIVKCDSSGRIEWTLTMQDCEGECFQYGFETETGYIFFGSKETPETKVTGVVSPADVFIQQVSFSGEATKTLLFAGSDYDSVWGVRPQSDGYLLFLSSQSSDGDFVRDGDAYTAAYWLFRLNKDLECESKEMCLYEEYQTLACDRIGYLDGAAVYSDDERFQNYDAGSVTAVLDYGAFYLVVSQHATEELVTPYSSSRRWFATETVYTAFDKSSDLLWRAATDNPLPY